MYLFTTVCFWISALGRCKIAGTIAAIRFSFLLVSRVLLAGTDQSTGGMQSTSGMQIIQATET